jgi:hypothetical protein
VNPLLLGPLLELGKSLIDRVLPDKTAQAKERADAEQALRQLAIDAEGKIADALAKSDENQTEVNKIEAASDSLFKSGWRPAVGWVGAVALFVYYVPYCLVATFIWAHQCWVTGQLVARPDLGVSDLFGLLAGILGLGYYRMREKHAGVA